MSSGVYDCIVLATREWFDKCLEKNCSIFCFPPNRKPKVRILSPGSICLVLIKEGVSRVLRKLPLSCIWYK